MSFIEIFLHCHFFFFLSSVLCLSDHYKSEKKTTGTLKKVTQIVALQNKRTRVTTLRSHSGKLKLELGQIPQTPPQNNVSQGFERRNGITESLNVYSTMRQSKIVVFVATITVQSKNEPSAITIRYPDTWKMRGKVEGDAFAG